MGFTSPFSMLLCEGSGEPMPSKDVSPVQTVGAGLFLARIQRSKTTAGDSEYLVELNVSSNVSVTLKFEDVKHLSQLLRLIATEVQHDGHAIQADREWIQRVIGDHDPGNTVNR